MLASVCSSGSNDHVSTTRALRNNCFGSGTLGFAGSTHYNDTEVNGEYHLTPSRLIGAAYDYKKGSRISSTNRGRLGGATYHQVSLGADKPSGRRANWNAASLLMPRKREPGGPRSRMASSLGG